MKDQNLFGPIDQAINTVEFEISCVKADIEKCRKTIVRKEEEIEELDGRLVNLKDLMAAVRKSRPKKK